MIEVSPLIILSEDEIEERFIRSPGPGGQKVNKTETAVQLHFDARRSANIPSDVFQRLKKVAGRRMTSKGVIVLTARRFRSQERNRADARERLAEMIRQAIAPPKSRRPTKPTTGSKKRRLENKKIRAALKKGRGKVDDFN